MAQQTIGVGTTANDNTGDPLRTAMVKVNANFTELYTGSHKARAFLSAADFSAPANVFSKIPFNAETFDVGGFFDTTTNRRYTPTTPGYYQVNSMVTFDPGAITGSTDYASVLYKNGVAYSQSEFRATIASGIVGAPLSDLVYLDGDDYLELFFYHNSAAARNVKAGPNLTFLSVAHIR